MPQWTWKVRKYGVSKRRTWRKLHLSMDVDSQEILNGELIRNSVDDAAMSEPLLRGVEGKVRKCYGDGAYDKKKARKAVARAGGEAVIPPPKNAVRSKNNSVEMMERNQAIDYIEQMGRKEWKQEAGYHRKSLSETAMHRYKMTIGNTLAARKMENQITEVRVGCAISRMYSKPVVCPMLSKPEK